MKDLFYYSISAAITLLVLSGLCYLWASWEMDMPGDVFGGSDLGSFERILIVFPAYGLVLSLLLGGISFITWLKYFRE